MTGQRVAHYQILEKLGEGGMGVVYKARDSHLDRFVAVKFLPPERMTDPARKARFAQEAKAASALSHPNIVTIHDISSDNGHDFIAMEFVEGKTLDQIIPRKGMRLGEALNIAIQIAGALARAHAAGIIHRDIKPANIMIDAHGAVKVLDFGLAKLTEPPGSDDETATIGVKTEEGAVVGTAAYMSPEQAEGKPLDARADIFSFGAVLYEMITGVRAFQGDSHASVIAAIMRDEPPEAGKLIADLPRSVDRIISRCLRKDIESRSQSIAEIKLELEEIREDLRSGVREGQQAPPSSRWRSLRWVLGGAALVLGGAGAWWLVSRGAVETPPKYHLRQITTGKGGSWLPVVSPDGKYVVYSSGREGTPDLWIQPVKGGEPTRLTNDVRSEGWTTFSPDGTQIVFSRRTGIFVLSIVGRKERQLTEEGAYPAFSPDGQHVAYRSQDGRDNIFWVIRAAGGVPRKIYSTQTSVAGPAWSPDGKMLLIGESRYALGLLGRASWKLLPVNGGPPVPVRGSEEVLKETPFPYPKFWLADGNRVIFGNWGQESHISYVRMSNTGEFLGKPVQLTYGTREHPGPSSLDGRVIPFSTGWNITTIYELPLDAARGVVKGEPKPALQWDSDAGFPTVSRDGSKMVFLANRDGNFDLWFRDLKTGEERPLLASPNRESRGIISPDGTKVAFQRHEEGHANCYWMPLPSGKETMFKPECKGLSGWTPDSRGIICSSGNPESFVIENIETQAALPTIANPQWNEFAFVASPDGRWLAFLRNRRGARLPHTLFIAPLRPDRPAREEEWYRVAGENFIYRPVWSPDGNALYFYQFDAAMDWFTCLFMRRLDPLSKRPIGEPIAVRHFHGNQRVSAGEAGTALLPDKLYLPLFEVGGQIWLAEQTR
jgi:Tol biopolymer transport system component/tRNA A-37 threonylcarbamoyl transferase component Bud32